MDAMSYKILTPNQKLFPGISTHISKFRSFDWIFGKTPPFSITLPLSVPSGSVKATCQIERGLIRTIEFSKEDNMLLSLAKRVVGVDLDEEQLTTKLEEMSVACRQNPCLPGFIDFVNSLIRETYK